jgi:hypothetical protein
MGKQLEVNYATHENEKSNRGESASPGIGPIVVKSRLSKIIKVESRQSKVSSSRDSATNRGSSSML